KNKPNKLDKLLADPLRCNQEKHLVLSAPHVPPNFLERARLTPVEKGRTGCRQRQIAINSDQSPDRNQRSVNQSTADKESRGFWPINDDRDRRQRQSDGDMVISQRQSKQQSREIQKRIMCSIRGNASSHLSCPADALPVDKNASPPPKHQIKNRHDEQRV